MDQPTIRLLLVDDEDDFRLAAGTALTRRGFAVTEASSGQEALDIIAHSRPDVVVLDLKMAGMGGLEVLQRARAIDPHLPVLILTGHGSFPDALAGVKLEVLDFLQKPVDVDLLADHLRRLLGVPPAPQAVHETALAELMVPAELYPRLYVDQPAAEALATLAAALTDPSATAGEVEIRSALVFDRDGLFLGTVRFADLMKLVLPRFLADAPYPTFYSGMLAAQCKVMGRRSFADLMGKNVTVDVRAPLLAAVHLMVRHRLSALPVMDGDRLVGVLRDRAVILEIARNVPTLG